VRTRAEPKPESPQLAWQTCLGFILRGLRVSVICMRAKQSQFPAVPGGTRPQGRGTRGKRAKQTQFPAVGQDPRSGLRKTNPISPAVPGGSGSGGRGSWRAIVQNEPNFPGDARWDEAAGPRSDGAASPVAGANHAKRTQFPPVGQDPGSRLCKTNPISAGAGRDGAAGARNAGQTCKTNPISERVSSVKCQVLSRASRASSPGSLPTSDFTLHTSNSAEGRSCETNPIPRGRAEAVDVESATICRPHPGQRRPRKCSCKPEPHLVQMKWIIRNRFSIAPEPMMAPEKRPASDIQTGVKPRIHQPRRTWRRVLWDGHSRGDNWLAPRNLLRLGDPVQYQA